MRFISRSAPGVNGINLYLNVTTKGPLLARVFVSVKFFQACLKAAIYAVTFPRMGLFICSSEVDMLYY